MFYDFVVSDYMVWIRIQVNMLLLEEFSQSTFFKSLILKIGECHHAKCFGSRMLMKSSVLSFSLSGSVRQVLISLGFYRKTSYI